MKSYTAIGVALLVFLLGAGIYAGNFRDMLGVSAILGSILILMNLQQFGYRVGWDDNGLYVRRWGVLNALNLKSEITSVRWDGILGLSTSIRHVFGRDWDYEPNEFLEITFGRTRGDRVRIYPYTIDMPDFENFARFCSEKVGKNIELE